MISQLTTDLVKIKRFIDNFEEGKLKLVDSIGNVYSKNNNFFYKLSLSNVLNETPFRSFYIDWLVESEKIFPNCSKELLKNLYTLHTQKEISLNYYRQHAKKEDLISILKDFLSEEGINLFLSLLDISGPDAMLNVKPSNILLS